MLELKHEEIQEFLDPEQQSSSPAQFQQLLSCKVPLNTANIFQMLKNILSKRLSLESNKVC